MANSNASHSISFFELLGLLFIGLRLTGHIDWDWWLVTLPIWGWWAFGLAVIGIAAIIDNV